VDGANAWEQMIHVTLPSIRPIMTIILFLAIIGSMNVFEQSWVLTGGGPFFASEVVAGYIYRNAFGVGSFARTNLGIASAASIFYNLILLGLTVAQLLVTRRASGREA
jgi:raffinose/stachyose/melibiose transport system permease protein